MKAILIKILILVLVLNLSAQDEIINKYISAKHYYNQGSFQKSLDLYKQVFQRYPINTNDTLYTKSGFGVIQSLFGVGNSLNENGDYFYAEIYLKLALYFNNKYKLLNREHEAYLLMMIGRNYGHLADYSNAMKYLEMALGKTPEASVKSKATISVELAYIYYQRGYKNQSYDVFEQAIDLFEQSDDGTLYDKARTLQRYALVLLYENKIVESEKMLLKSYKLVIEKDGEQSDYGLYATNHLGYFYKRTGEYKKSIEYFHKTIRNVIPDFTNDNLYSFPKKAKLEKHTELLYALRYKAHAFFMLYKEGGEDIKDLNAAIEGFDLVFELIDYVRSEYNSQESSLFFAESYRETIDNALMCAIEQYHIDRSMVTAGKVFEYIERGKSSLLYHSILETSNKRRSGVPLQLIQQEKALKSKISLLKLKMDQPDNIVESIDLMDDLFILLDKREKLKTLISEYNLKQLDLVNEPEYVSMTDLQKRLKSDEVVLEYSLTDTLLLSFFLSKDGYLLQIDSINSDFHESVIQLREYLAHPDFTADFQLGLEAFSKESYFLYQKLIKPYEQEIKNKSVIIIPDEKLLYIPFEVLLCTENGGAKDYRKLDYFLIHNPVSYTYSAALKYGLQESKYNTENILASFSPDYSSDSYCGSESVELSQLPYAREETDYIAKLFDGECFGDERATERAFIEQAVNYSIVHLALHTTINDSIPMLSKFHFTCVADSVYDNSLDLFELNSIELNARLVVLSGCNTGYGHLYNGEGLYNMARGFIQAGCPSLVLSIWDLSDYAGFRIIKGFYENLNNGDPLDISMQKSKKDYLKTANKAQAHPFFWSSYISIGDQKPIELKNEYTLEVYIFLIVISFCALIYWVLRKMKKTKQS